MFLIFILKLLKIFRIQENTDLAISAEPTNDDNFKFLI